MTDAFSTHGAGLWAYARRLAGDQADAAVAAARASAGPDASLEALRQALRMSVVAFMPADDADPDGAVRRAAAEPLLSETGDAAWASWTATSAAEPTAGTHTAGDDWTSWSGPTAAPRAEAANATPDQDWTS